MKSVNFFAFLSAILVFSVSCAGAPSASTTAVPTSAGNPPSATSVSSSAGPNATPTASSPASTVAFADSLASTVTSLIDTGVEKPGSSGQSTPTAPQNKPSNASTSTRANRDKGIILGYYVPYDPTSWASLQANADNLDYVAPQWVNVDACGNIGSRGDKTLVAFARSKGIKIVPSLLTGNDDLNHHLLTDEGTPTRAIEQIVSYIKEEGYDGLDLDLENIRGTDRDAYTAFVKSLSTALHKNGKLLTAAIPAKSFDATTGWAGAFDYAATGPYFDLVTIMTYEYSSPTGKPGSTAPVDWVDKVIAYVTSQIPSNKVLVGVAFYGYDWNLSGSGRARALRHPQAAALADAFGATVTLDPTTKSPTFSFVMKPGDKLPADEKVPALNHDMAVRSQAYCPLTPATPTPRPTPPKPTATPVPTVEQEHVVWFENARSVGFRLGIATKYNTAGVGTWRLGQEDPDAWSVMADWRQGPNK